MKKDNSDRVTLGGSWLSDPRRARVTRYGFDLSSRYDILGFRLYRSINPLQQLSEIGGQQ